MTFYILFQIKQIVPFWIAGLLIGAIASSCTDKLIKHIPYRVLGGKSVLTGCITAALAGAASPITMYGMLPILAVLSKLKIRQSVICSLIVTSILINPNVFIFSFSLGGDIAVLRLVMSLSAGVIAGLLAEVFFKNENLYDMSGFTAEQRGAAVGQKSFMVIAANFRKALVRTAPNLAIGIILAALFENYFPMDFFKYVFGKDSGLGVLFAASLGVSAYYCGGGTIPIIRAWMNEGMSLGAVMTFMLTGPATKLTNLTAVKAIMPARTFSLYLAFNIAFGITAGFIINLIINL